MRQLVGFCLFFCSVLVLLVSPTFAQKKSNILVIFGDDVGFWSVSAYNQGMMSYKTPNIDRIAHEGALFTDYYAQQSCIAGRAAPLATKHLFCSRRFDT